MISKKRHIAKAISYRLLGSLFTAILVSFVTENISLGGWIGIADCCIKTVLYYAHERVWYRYIKFGVYE